MNLRRLKEKFVIQIIKRSIYNLWKFSGQGVISKTLGGGGGNLQFLKGEGGVRGEGGGGGGGNS